METTRYWLPLALGVAAAVCNYVVLQSATATVQLVALRADLKPGEKITADHLRPVPVRGEALLWQQTVPYAQVGSLVGKTGRRELRAGELVLRADLEHEPFQIAVERLPAGYSTLTLPAPRKALNARPLAGDIVKVHVLPRNGGASRASGRLLFLGSYVEPSKVPGSESDLACFVVAVPDVAGPSDLELREIQAGGDRHRISAVEIVVPHRDQTDGR